MDKYLNSKDPLVKSIYMLLPCIEGNSNLNANLDKLDTADKDLPYIKALCFGTARFYHRFKLIKSKLLTKPLAKKDKDLDILLSIAMFELCERKTPDYAVVNNCVNTVNNLNKHWAKGFINAILRNFIRYYRDNLVADKFDKIADNVTELEILKYSHPLWFIEKLKRDYPNDYSHILLANNAKPPLTLRVNPNKISSKDYLTQLQNNAIAAHLGDLPTSIYVEDGINVEKLPNFNNGYASLQDETGQLVVDFMQLQPNLKVLDTCAAPGGKTTAMLENCSNIDLTALDKDEHRLEKIRENLNRLNLSSKVIQADLLALPENISSQKYDRILLDAPCSATGIIRRHADIKLMRNSKDINKFAQQQLQMLNIAKQMLNPNGILLYATCSILATENSEVIKKFLQQNSDVLVDLSYIKRQQQLKDILKYSNIDEYGIQFLPQKDTVDGFFYAPIRFKS